MKRGLEAAELATEEEVGGPYLRAVHILSYQTPGFSRIPMCVKWTCE